MDPECQQFIICAEFSVAACQDGIDNDQDGLVDCEDGDCQEILSEVCTKAEDSDALCNDGIDNDGDGLIDCLDDECTAIWPCYVSETRSLYSLKIKVLLEGPYLSLIHI